MQKNVPAGIEFLQGRDLLLVCTGKWRSAHLNLAVVRAAREQIALRASLEPVERPLLLPDSGRVKELVHGAAVGERAGRAAVSEVGVAGGCDVATVIANFLQWGRKEYGTHNPR